MMPKNCFDFYSLAEIFGGDKKNLNKNTFLSLNFK